jgi:hypothetical protein
MLSETGLLNPLQMLYLTPAAVLSIVVVRQQYVEHWCSAIRTVDDRVRSVNMIIKFQDGTSVEGCLLSRGDNWLRVAVKNGDDVAVLASVDGAWISEDRGPVEVVFEWQRRSRLESISESDCVCSKELAARLIRLLLTGDEEESEDDTLFGLPLPHQSLARPSGIQLVN